MATTKVLTDNFSLGSVSDVAPNKMKPNMARMMLNFIPDYMNASLVLRPGWEYAYNANADFTTFSASSTSISGTNYASFMDGGKQVYVDQSGRIMSLATSGVGSLLDSTGLGVTQGGPGVFHLDYLVLPPSDGAHYPWYVSTNGSGVASATAFSDPFPQARTGASWGAYLLMANGGDFANSYTQNLRRLWFSDPGSFTFTAANNSYWDFPKMERIMAVAASANAILVFGPGHFEILTGTTPPPNSDLQWRYGYNYGLCDANAIKQWNGFFIFVNERGVFKTDGTSLVDVTQQCGLRNKFGFDMQNFAPGWTCALGIYQDYAIVTVTNGTAEQFTYVFDLSKEVGFNFKGFQTKMYAEVAGPQASNVNSEQDLIFGQLSLAQAGRMQPVFSPGTPSGADANGAKIPFELWTPFYMLGSMTEKRIRRAYFSYYWDATTPFTEAIRLSYSMTNNPFQGQAWIDKVLPFTPAASITSGRQPVFVNDKGRWITFRLKGGPGAFNSSGAGTKFFALFGIEVEGHLEEGSKSDMT